LTQRTVVWNTLVVSSGIPFRARDFSGRPPRTGAVKQFSRRQQAGNEGRRVTPIANAGPVRAGHEKRCTT